MGLLILSRKASPNNDTVVVTVPPSAVERTIEVVFVRREHTQVKFGFRADRDIVIMRKELVPA